MPTASDTSPPHAPTKAQVSPTISPAAISNFPVGENLCARNYRPSRAQTHNPSTCKARIAFVCRWLGIDWKRVLAGCSNLFHARHVDDTCKCGNCCVLGYQVGERVPRIDVVGGLEESFCRLRLPCSCIVMAS